jgi:hypothetical protein
MEYGVLHRLGLAQTFGTSRNSSGIVDRKKKRFEGPKRVEGK